MATSPDADTAQPITFYTDADLDGPIVKAAIQSGLSIVRCQDVGMTDASDREHLEYASKNQLVLVSHDATTMTAEHEQWLAEEKAHSGIIIIPRKHCKQIPDIIEYLRWCEMQPAVASLIISCGGLSRENKIKSLGVREVL